MKVYSISVDVNRYRTLVPKDRKRWAELTELDGTPKAEQWGSVEVMLQNPKGKPSDFLAFGISALAIDTNTAPKLSKFFQPAGEVLPVFLDGKEFSVLNVTAIFDCLDAKQSTWLIDRPDGTHNGLQKPVFIPQRFGQSNIFKLREDFGASFYCIAIAGDPEHEFKAYVEARQLTGLIFDEVWSDGTQMENGGHSRDPLPPKKKRAQVPKRAASDRPLRPDEQMEIQNSIAWACELLKLDPHRGNPKEAQKAIHEHIASVRTKAKLSDEDITNLAVGLGCLWGQSVCDTLQWQWCFASVESSGFFAIVTPSRSHIIAPMAFVREQLLKPASEDNTSLLLFNMITAGLPRAESKAYLQLG